MNLEKTVAKNVEKIVEVEGAVQMISKLTVSHLEQLERMLFRIDELKLEQKQTQEKLNALIDAQIREEDRFHRFRKETQNSTREMPK